MKTKQKQEIDERARRRTARRLISKAYKAIKAVKDLRNSKVQVALATEGEALAAGGNIYEALKYNNIPSSLKAQAREAADAAADAALWSMRKRNTARRRA